MSKSIMQDEKVCYLNSGELVLDKHHIFNGPFRKLSEKYGLWVWLGHNTHLYDVHEKPENMLKLKQEGQRVFEKKYGHVAFMQIFKKNYLAIEL